MLKKYTIIFLSLISQLSTGKGFAQSEKLLEKNDSLLKVYLAQSRFDIDTNAQAVVLFEKGYSSLRDGHFTYYVEKMVKILGTEAINNLSLVNISIADYSQITKVKGITYNLEHDQITKQHIEKTDILKDKINKDFTITKFNLPGVKKGSIIYYTYTVEKPGFITIPDWYFQSKYPTLYSEYSIYIPSDIVYTPLERVSILTRANSWEALRTCEGCTFAEPPMKGLNTQTWVRRNIPAFKEEPFMSSSDNFIERVKIHVSSVRLTYSWMNIYKDWKEIVKENMYDNELLGGQIKLSNRFLNEKTDELTKGVHTDLEKAQTIFAYVRDNFTAKESSDGYRADVNIKDIFHNKEGSNYGMNILLTAMLKKAGLESDMVALSTRKNEKLNGVFPDPSKINYLVSKVNIDHKDYFLDASIKQIPFGILLPECYNGYCRVINEKGDAVYLEPDSVNDKTATIISIKPDQADKNKLSLKLTKQFGQLSGMHYRTEWNKDTASIRKMILKEISSSTAFIQLKNYSVDNLNNPDKPLKISYEAIGELTKNTDVNTIYLNPYFEKFFENNPFIPETRKFGIEMNYLEDYNYILHFQLPEGYVLDDFPKSIVKQFSEKGLIVFKNVVDYKSEQNSFSITSRLSRKATHFQAEDYTELKNFYRSIVEEQNKKFIIKKLK